MRKVYVVMGSYGEYSDRVEYPVRAFFVELLAKARVIACTRRAAEWAQLRDILQHHADCDYDWAQDYWELENSGDWMEDLGNAHASGFYNEHRFWINEVYLED